MGRDKMQASSPTEAKAGSLTEFPSSHHVGPHNSRPAATTSHPAPVVGALGPELAEKVRELVRLAQDQGYLTYSDINEALTDTTASPAPLDEICAKLRNLEIDIVEQAEVDRIKQPEPEEEEDKHRLDILDDPVRMYLKQMGQVPLLTREQEVEISKRIEHAEEKARLILCSLGFAGKEHIALAEKLVCD